MGPCGAGKTHLAVAALRQIVLRGHTALLRLSRTAQEIQGSYNPEANRPSWACWEPVLTADVLLLDDLGASKTFAMGARNGRPHSQHAIQRAAHHLLTTNYLDGTGTESAPPGPRLPSGQAVAPARETRSQNVLGKRIRSRLYECAARSNSSLRTTAAKCAKRGA